MKSIWLIEDNSTYRKVVARVVNRIEGLSCTGQFGSFEEASPAMAAGPQPDLILLDVGLPGLNGIEALGYIRARCPQAKVIILTVFDDSEKIVKSICAGASGYLLKTATLAEIAAAIRQTLAGGSAMTPKVARRVLELFAAISQAAPERGQYELTEREREILQLMVDGLIKKEIAMRLGISVHTVSTHLRSIYEKLHVTTNTGAVSKALREKLI